VNIQGTGIIATDKRILTTAGRLLQVAALVCRNPGPNPEILLITSRGTGRWIITVYAKPQGRPLVDTFVTEVSQDTWIYFPWDMGFTYQEPIAKSHRG